MKDKGELIAGILFVIMWILALLGLMGYYSIY